MKKKDILFGRNSIIESINSGQNIEQVYVAKNAHGEEIQKIFSICAEKNIPVRKVPIEKINYVLYPFYNDSKISHQGVVAFVSDYEYAKIEDIYLQKLDKGKHCTFIFLDNLTDVRNFGAIARSALCFNVDAILIPNKNSVTVTADAIKTSAGALSQLPICRIDNPIEQLEYFIDCGFQIVGATEKSNQSYREIDWTLPSILVLGSEGRGISYNVIEKLTHKVTIPMDKTAFDSLNVSVSAGIILSEIFVQNS